MNKPKIILTEENAYSLPDMKNGAIASVKVTAQDVSECDAILIGLVVSDKKDINIRELVCSNKDNNLYLKHLNGTDKDKSVIIEVPVLKNFEDGVWLRGIAFFFSKNNGVNAVYSSEYRHFCKQS